MNNIVIISASSLADEKKHLYNTGMNKDRSFVTLITGGYIAMGKRNILLLLFVAMLTVLAGCEKKDSMEDRKALVDLIARMEEQEIPFPEERANSWYLLSMQFYQGESVQIWSAKKADGTLDIFLFHEDGSREGLMTGVPSNYGNSKWFLDSEGHCILLQSIEGNVIRLDDQGEEIYRRTGKNIRDICQLPDGRIIVLLWEKDSSQRLGELHCDTGIVDDIDTVGLEKDFGQFIGAGKSGLLLLDKTGLWEINLMNGEKECIMAFDASYDPGNKVEDFRMLKDGRLEVLQYRGKLQKLELFDPVAGREIIVVRGSSFNSEMEQCVVLFNQTNEDYYVYLEACPETSDRLDFGSRTLVELGTGKGPDIICAPLLSEELWSLIENGYVEDLAPWIKKTGIREEDYFPGAFAYPRDGDKIYGINTSVSSGTYYISRAVLGDQADPDIETLVEALAGYDGEGVFARLTAQRILRYFLEGSEDLWGMLDPETGSCRFDGELFAKMLRVARRYADDGKNIRPVLFETGDNTNYYCSEYDRQQYAEKGMVEIGHFFDNGRHGANATATWMAVASTSPYKEGAWAFLQFLLSDQCQMIGKVNPAFGSYPVSKKCYDEMAKQAIAEGAFRIDTVNKHGRPLGAHGHLLDTLGRVAYNEIFGPTKEKAEQVRHSLEDSQMPSLKTIPILDLICEDAEAYFSGTKSIEEVTPIIQNRVQLYLDEHR